MTITFEAHPIDDTTPKDREIAIYRNGVWSKGRWENDDLSLRPRPYWFNDSCLRINDMRAMPPTHWAELSDMEVPE